MGCNTIQVPKWKLERAAEVLERDGDEHGVGADIRGMLRVAESQQDGLRALLGSDGSKPMPPNTGFTRLRLQEE